MAAFFSFIQIINKPRLQYTLFIAIGMAGLKLISVNE